jgi:hypothetical protein
VPAIGIAISASLSTALVLVQVSGAPGVRAVYNTIVSLSTMTAVVPYAFCALAGALIGAHGAANGQGRRIGVVEIVGFVFALFTLYGCGPEPVLYGLMLLMLGIPVYVWQRRRS